jgi:predicted ArsR family transcriptional regulator
MGGAAELPAAVTTFLDAHVGSLEHLELLLLVMQTPHRWWDASAASDELGMHPDAARRGLDHLAARNLLAISVTGDVRYQYQPGRAELDEAARLVADAYRHRRLAVLQLVTQPERRGLRDFADAFRIRRDDDR